jgi:hypothetical protein
VAEEVTGIGALGLLVPDRFAPELAGLLAQPACDTPCTFAAAPAPVARIRPDASATPTITLRITPRPWFMTVSSCLSARYTGDGAAEIPFVAARSISHYERTGEPDVPIWPRWRHLSADVRCARSVLERTAQIGR